MEETLLKPISIAFNRQKGRFLLSMGDLSVQQNVCEFLHTASFLVGKNLEEYLLSTDNQYDTVRIPLTGSGKTVTLALGDFIRFREAYSQQLFVLKLEDMLMRKGVKLPDGIRLNSN